MESIYLFLFIIFAIPAAFLEYSDNACFGLLSSGRGQQFKPEYLRFRNNYVVIFSLMMGEEHRHHAINMQCILSMQHHHNQSRPCICDGKHPS